MCIQSTTESALETDCCNAGWITERLNSWTKFTTLGFKNVCRRQYVADLIIQNVRQLIIQRFNRHIFKAASSVCVTSSLIFLLFEMHTFKTISSFGLMCQGLYYSKVASLIMVLKLSVKLKTSKFLQGRPRFVGLIKLWFTLTLIIKSVEPR